MFFLFCILKKSFEEAIQWLEKYNQCVPTEKRENELMKQLVASLQEEKDVLNHAMELIEKKLELPPLPTSLVELAHHLHSLRDSVTLVRRYLQVFLPLFVEDIDYFYC